MPDPAPKAGLHLVKTTDPAEDSLASDVVDILTEGLRGSTDTDTGGVESDYVTTREADEARQTEAEFFRAVGAKLRQRCGDWADGKRGLHILELHEVGRRGWKFGVFDREGRLFEVETLWSQIEAIAAMQRVGTISNFEHVLDRIVAQFQEQRRHYFARMGGVVLQ